MHPHGLRQVSARVFHEHRPSLLEPVDENEALKASSTPLATFDTNMENKKSSIILEVEVQILPWQSKEAEEYQWLSSATSFA